jgi:O-antigen ligase/tetratricopeptide (TPR) repeat protein
VPLDRVAAALAALALMLRVWIPAPSAGSGLNLLLHALPPAGLACWAASRALARTGAWRATPLDLPLLALALLALGSVVRASYALAAFDAALAYAGLATLAVLLVQTLGRRGLLDLLLAVLASVVVYALVQRFVLFPALQGEADAQASVELARRIRNAEVFATFGGPNQLAGALALLLPLLAGSIFDVPGEDRRGRALRAALLGLGMLAIVFTGSLGGWVALAGAGATGAALALTRKRGRNPVLGAGLSAAAVIALFLCSTPLPEELTRNHSLHVRDVYWKATRQMIAQAPLGGHGLDQWQEHYFALKGEVQQESRKAHNDYLQVFAELGLPGLLALLALLGAGLAAGLSRRAPAEDPASTLPPFEALAALAFGFAALAGRVVGDAAAFLLAAVAWGTFRLLRGGPVGEGTRIGAVAGLAGAMIHLLVDYDLNEAGGAALIFAVLALLGTGAARPVPLPLSGLRAAALGLAGVALFLLAVPVPRLLAADREREAALESLEAGRTEEAVRLLESARVHNPRDAAIPAALARIRRSVEDVDAALALQPRSSPLHHLKSRLLRERKRLPEAVESQRRALELYPGYAGNAYDLALLLDEAGRREEAKPLYETALRLDARAAEEPENLDRLKLGPTARARCLWSLDRPGEARADLHASLRARIARTPPPEARTRLVAWRTLALEEGGEALGPVIREVVDAILQELP